jgi:hypothetical protein
VDKIFLVLITSSNLFPQKYAKPLGKNQVLT